MSLSSVVVQQLLVVISMVQATSLKRAHRVAARLQSGIIWVNCWLFRDLRTPFDGMKQSGRGEKGDGKH